MKKILIIDDDEQVCKTLAKVFSGEKHTVSYHQTLKDGLSKIFSDDIDVVFMDVNLPDGNGIEAIKTIKQRFNAPEVIIITGDEDIDGAELAIRSQAWDYIFKREPNKIFKFALNRSLEYRKQKQSQQTGIKINRDSIVGKSQQISFCLDQVSKAAANDLSILITGETGTGKELFAKSIHINSRRSEADFVVVDCATLPENLVESSLFGHVKGAFTNADSNKKGLMTMADKGTLFLDEIGELPLNIQGKFLRALQEKKFRPVGGKTEVTSDFRLVCATHRDLKNMVSKNLFREDLFFRIYSMNIHLPSLENRKNDIQELVENHLSRKKMLSKEDSYTVSQELIEELQAYEWPGNIRELINTIDLVCSNAGPGSILFPYHLPGSIRAHNIRKKFKVKGGKPSQITQPYTINESEIPLKFNDHFEKLKHDYLQTLIRITNGNIKEACTTSGLSRGHLYRLLKQHNIKIM